MKYMSFMLAMIFAANSFAGELHELEGYTLSTYDKIVGQPEVRGDPIRGDYSGVWFSGKVLISGNLRFQREPDDVDDACNGICASFLPDAQSAKRLPRLVIKGTTTEIGIDAIDLFEGKPIMVKALGAIKAKSVLSKNFNTYQVPAKITITDYHIEIGCDHVYYEATFVNAFVTSYLAQTTNALADAGC